jgi:hypothetical protein
MGLHGIVRDVRFVYINTKKNDYKNTKNDMQKELRALVYDILTHHRAGFFGVSSESSFSPLS